MKITKHLREFLAKQERLHNRKLVVVQLKSGHYMIKDAATNRVLTTIPNSPSDHRWQKNATSHIRRELAK